MTLIVGNPVHVSFTYLCLILLINNGPQATEPRHEKPAFAFAIAKAKRRAADQRLYCRYRDKTIPLHPKSEIHLLWLYSPVRVGPLSLTGSALLRSDLWDQGNS